MKAKLKIGISLFILIGNLCLYSQESSIFKNDYLDPFITNPACTGAENYPVAHLSSEKQWLGFAGSPSTLLLSGNMRLGNYDKYNPKDLLYNPPANLKDRIGIGAAIFKDSNGPLANTGGIVSFGYHLNTNENAKLSFGMSIIIVDYSINTTILKTDQSNDYFLYNGANNSFKTNFSTGVYYHNNIFFTGLSINKFLPGISNINEQTIELPSYFLMGGYKFYNNNIINFEPSIEIKELGNENTIIDIHAKLYLKKLNWIAISFNTKQQMSILIGLRLYKMLYIGYNYGYSLGNIANYNYGSQEISLGINLGLIGLDGIKNIENNSK